MTEYNNPPAFPTKQPLSSDFLGLTMLDHFAGLAMQGMLAASENYQTSELAEYAYQVADAMLKERERWIR